MIKTHLSKLNLNEINSRLGNRYFLIVIHLQMLYGCVELGMLVECCLPSHQQKCSALITGLYFQVDFRKTSGKLQESTEESTQRALTEQSDFNH